MIAQSEILLRDFAVTQSDLDKALNFQLKIGGRLEQLLVNLGSLSEDRLPEYYSKLFQLPIYNADAYSPYLSALFDENQRAFLSKYDWYTVGGSDHKLRFAVRYPLEVGVHDFLTSLDIVEFETFILEQNDFHVFKNWLLEHNSSEEPATYTGVENEEERLKELASEAPTVNLLNALITKALRLNASDMHLEPVNNLYRVRFRIDGVLHDIESLPARLQLPVTTRLKILSGMDIAEKRRPQDGKISIKIANQELDIRASALPLNEGESIVLRFLKKESIKYDMSVLGIEPDVVKSIYQDLKKTSGVVLMTGPTGSGKTTTLYTFLNHLNNDDVKIITLEDPVEYQLPGVNQVQVNPDIDLSFASGLRSIVRQDPDVIMIGEIRDKETAQIALQSALTGHLVFSTVHTNDAPSAYTRLMDLGVEEFLLNAGLVSIVAQRLVRKLCPNCQSEDLEAQAHIEQYDLNELMSQFNMQSHQLSRANGCSQCSETGFKGRVAIIEYLPCDNVIKSIPKDESFIANAREYQIKMKRRNLLEDGFIKALKGITTIEEVIRVAG